MILVGCAGCESRGLLVDERASALDGGDGGRRSADPAERPAPSRRRRPGGQAGRGKAGPQIEGDRMTSFAPVVMSKQTESSPFRFAEIAKEAGIDFVHFSGMTEEKHFPTANGSGVAVFDYDSDGLLDIYFATATLLPLGTAEKGPNRLYKNLGNGHFKDVTEKSGPGLSRLLPRDHRRRHRQRRRSVTSSCATTAATSCTSTTATGPSRTSASRPASTRPTGRPAARCSTTTTTAISTST